MPSRSHRELQRCIPSRRIRFTQQPEGPNFDILVGVSAINTSDSKCMDTGGSAVP